MLHSKSAILESFHKALHIHMGKAEGGGDPPNMMELNVRNTMKAIAIPRPQETDNYCFRKERKKCESH